MVGTFLPATTISVPFGQYGQFISFPVSVLCSHLFGEAPCAHGQHQYCPCTQEPWQPAAPAACRDVPPAPMQGCPKMCPELPWMREKSSPKGPPVLLLREGCDRSQCQEGPSQGSEAWRDRHGTGIWDSLSHRAQQAAYQQLKIPEGSKAVNAREAKSKKNFINCVILFLFVQNSSYLCLFILLSHIVIQSQNGFHCVQFPLKKKNPSQCMLQ